MKIGVDAGSLGVSDERLKVGVYNLTREFLIHLSKIDKKNNYFLYSFIPIEDKILSLLGSNFQNIVIRPKKGWASIWLPLRSRRDKIDIFLGLNQFIPNFLPRSTKRIGFVYDLAFQIYPQMFQDTKDQLERITKSVVSNSDDIITISRNSKKDIISRYKIGKDKIHVLYPGYKKMKFSKNKAKDIFLYVGALKLGKNIPNIICAFEEFQKKHPSDTKLVIVGGDRWLDDEIEIAVSEVSKPTKKKIVFKGHVTDKELESLYAKAIAFVSPSFYEGFGLTHAEAMAAGIPVIASDRGSLPEVVGNAGILVDPESSEKIAKAMSDIATNKKLRSVLSKKGIEKSKNYSWEKFAGGVSEMIQSYEKA